MQNNNKKDNKSLVFSLESSEFIKKRTDSLVFSKKRVDEFVDYLVTTGDYQESLNYSELSDIEKISAPVPIFKESTINSISDCSSWVEFREYTKLEKTTLHNANFCKRHKVCKACAMRRSAKQVQKYHKIITSSPDLMSKSWYYIVLPVKHNINESFSTVYERVNDAIGKIRKARRNTRGKSFFRQFDGIMIALEVTKSSNGWNIHLNLLCCTDNKIQGIKKRGGTFIHDELIENWRKVTDNNSFIVSINELNFNDGDELQKNLLEIFKYTLKFSDMSNQDLLEVYKNTFGKRLLRGWGIFNGLKEEIDLSDTELIGQEYIELIVRFVRGNYQEYSRTRKISTLPLAPLRKKQSPVIHRNKKLKFIEIVHQDKYGNTISKIRKINHAAISDFEIFAATMRRKV
jgi:hypothetical protein